MKITIGQLRQLIREAMHSVYMDEEDLGQGHEPDADYESVQMNHQGDHGNFDEMGHPLDEMTDEE